MAAGARLALPPAIREWLAGTIERHWREPEGLIAAIPDEMPEGQVQALARGGPFGLMFDGRLDRVDGRIALEVLENSRMSGENYFRVWEDGSVEPLEPAVQIFMITGRDASPEERARAQEDYFANNRRAYEHLRRRGFQA